MQKNANLLFNEILKTPPLVTNPSAETIFYCALGESACRQYITMAKSFLRYSSNVAAVVQDDGTLKNRQIDELKEHIVGVQILKKEAMFKKIKKEAGDELLRFLPDQRDYYKYTAVRIMYLKFLNVILRFNGRKIIIVDSDLIFLKRPCEIIEWIEQPYTYDFYGEGSNNLAEDFYRMKFEFKSLNISNFSSGTMGIGGYISLEKLVEIFKRINEYNPSLFFAWEIEQALWSVVLADRPNVLNLDTLRPIYIGSAWRPCEILMKEAVIAHFAGAARFNRLCYLRSLRKLVRELKNQG